jgi:hypothetical protein
MRKRTRFSILISIALGLGACNREIRLVKAEPGGGFASLFDGFAYIGSDVNMECHLSSGVDVPALFLPGHEYVFHHTKPFNSMEFARTAQTQRLQMLGFSLTKNVDTGFRGTIDPGGAVWSLEFERGDCSGRIFTRPCADLIRMRPFKDDRWTESDYVLKLRGPCAN